MSRKRRLRPDGIDDVFLESCFARGRNGRLLYDILTILVGPLNRMEICND